MFGTATGSLKEPNFVSFPNGELLVFALPHRLPEQVLVNRRRAILLVMPVLRCWLVVVATLSGARSCKFVWYAIDLVDGDLGLPGCLCQRSWFAGISHVVGCDTHSPLRAGHFCFHDGPPWGRFFCTCSVRPLGGAGASSNKTNEMFPLRASCKATHYWLLLRV